MNYSSIRIGSIMIATLGLSACSHEQKPSEHSALPPGASAPARELRDAVEDITTARCDLEARCNNIGGGQKFDNREACESKLHGSIANDFNTKDCPHGLDRSKLAACVSQIQAEECGSPMDSMSRWAACRRGEVCLSD